MLIKLLKSPNETVAAYENWYDLVCRTLLSPAQAWLSFGSGLLTLLTRRGAVKT